jgi:hypothetical protein
MRKKLRTLTAPIRYSITMGVVRVLTPTLCKEIKEHLIERPMMNFVYEKFGKTPLVGAEIGVETGDNSLYILKTLNITKLYLVDPYAPYMDGDEGTQRDSTEFYTVAQNTLKKYEEKVQFILRFSEQAAELLPENLDFVYIDANHNYEHVKKDIEVYYPKIKGEGVIGGHDFSTPYQGLMRAVTEFNQRLGIKLYVKQPDWWVVKP